MVGDEDVDFHIHHNRAADIELARQAVLEGVVTAQTLPFGQLLRHMMSVRNIGARALAKKAYLPEDAISLIARGLCIPNSELERKLRAMLDWPDWLDEVLTIVLTTKHGDPVPSMLINQSPPPVTQPPAQLSQTVETPTSPKPASPAAPRFNKNGAPRKPWGTNRKARPDDDLDETIGDNDDEPLVMRGAAIA